MIKKIIEKLVTIICRIQFKLHLFENTNKFKNGDMLVYNWKAKILIDSAIKDKLEPRKFVNYLYKDKSNVLFEDGDSCASFWVKKY